MTDAEHYPPCAFVDALKQAEMMRGRFSPEDVDPQLVVHAYRMRLDSGWTNPDSLPGSRVSARGVVYAWCAHDDAYGYRRADALHGEIDGH